MLQENKGTPHALEVDRIHRLATEAEGRLKATIQSVIVAETIVKPRGRWACTGAE